MKEHTITTTEHDDYVDALHNLTETIRFLGFVQDDLVKAARQAGVPWGSIAAGLGITRQGAQQRYGHKVPDPHQLTLGDDG